MQKIFKTSSILILVLGLAFASCNSAKKSQCGCPNKQGFIGYR